MSVHVGAPPPAPSCPHCDAVKSMEARHVDARVVFTYDCTCCGKTSHFAANHLLLDYEAPTKETDVNGHVLEE